jgi:hypothetical protein
MNHKIKGKVYCNDCAFFKSIENHTYAGSSYYSLECMHSSCYKASYSGLKVREEYAINRNSKFNCKNFRNKSILKYIRKKKPLRCRLGFHLMKLDDNYFWRCQHCGLIEPSELIGYSGKMLVKEK